MPGKITVRNYTTLTDYAALLRAGMYLAGKKEEAEDNGFRFKVKINTESATRKTDGLTGKVKQLGKTVISPVIKAKDAASATITKVSNGIKTVMRASRTSCS